VSKFLDQAEIEYPDVDLEQEMKAAAGWLMANPDKRKSRLAPYLMGWFKRSKNPPAYMKDRPPPTREEPIISQEMQQWIDSGHFNKYGERIRKAPTND
jgi:hypothetical protein